MLRRGGGPRRQSAGAIRALAMPTIDALPGAQCLALAHFIEAHLRVHHSMHWRTAFYEGTRRGHFFPYATAEESMQLMRFVCDFGPLAVCYFKTASVLRAAHEVTAPASATLSEC